MPVTTDSELALKYYEAGSIEYDQLRWKKAQKNFEMAIQEDPDFFMAYFWLYKIAHKESKKIAEKALQTSAPLNDAEKEIKAAFKYLLDGQNEKVVEHLNNAIDLYPSDPHLYKSLYILQFHMMKDLEGAMETIYRSLEVQPEFAPAYNLLGYALMETDEYDKAEKAFDDYIRLAPDIANPYDSKGDYFLNTEQYEKAIESYMKAFEIDSGFYISEKKAKKARYLLEKSMQ